jgi:hypothetical protein
MGATVMPDCNSFNSQFFGISPHPFHRITPDFHRTDRVYPEIPLGHVTRGLWVELALFVQDAVKHGKSTDEVVLGLRHAPWHD